MRSEAASAVDEHVIDPGVLGPPAGSPAELDPSLLTSPEAGAGRRTGPASRRTSREILGAFGMDLATAGTRDTPKRFLRALYDATAGYEGDPKLMTAFPSRGRRATADSFHGQIVEGPISFGALCEHHALPFDGDAHIGYVAGDQIIGISKLTRLVRLFARRFTVQERLGEQIADTLVELIEPRGRRRPPRGVAPVHADARRRGALAGR